MIHGGFRVPKLLIMRDSNLVTIMDREMGINVEHDMETGLVERLLAPG